MKNREIIFLKPCLKETLWGGSSLRDFYEYADAGAHTGECWGISAHENGDCIVAEGPFRGMTLSELYTSHRELFGGCVEDQFPLLVKLIDAKEKLSIQVHPDDSYARTNEHALFGKKECWYIIDCPEHAALMIGNHAKDKKELLRSVEDGEFEEMVDFLPVKAGDFIQIDPGTVHAITEDFLILEIQQSCDITYRIYDYNRLYQGQKRELHIKQAIDCIRVPDYCEQKTVVHTGSMQSNVRHLLESNDRYRVWKLRINGSIAFPQEEKFLLVSVIRGSGRIGTTKLKMGEFFLLPCAYGTVELCGNMELILSAPQ